MKIGWKKLVSLALTFAVLLTTVMVWPQREEVDASSYPVAFFTNADGSITVSREYQVGTEPAITFIEYPEYKNERYSLYIYKDGVLMDSVENSSFYNTSSSARKFTVNWPSAKNYPAGEYKAVLHLEFYSLYRWNECPTDKILKITLSANGPTTPTPTPQPTATPVPTATPTPEVSRLPAFTPNSSGSGVSGFVDRLYTVVLNRSAEASGKEYWINQVQTGANTGADAARGFLLSEEFTSNNYSNSDFVEVLYRLFFNRNSDAAGKAGWVSALNNGASREDVISGFVNSTEWANVCLTYGIRSGGTGTPSFTKTASKAVKAFATRLYTTCLGRDPETEGLEWWASELANMRRSGTEAAYGFFFSEEFQNHNFSNEEYVTRLYRTFMGREPDTEGFNYWISQLNSGASREDVFTGFSIAPEFAQICADAGIIR